MLEEQNQQIEQEDEKDDNSDSDFGDDDEIMQSLREQRIAQMKEAQAEHL